MRLIKKHNIGQILSVYVLVTLALVSIGLFIPAHAESIAQGYSTTDTDLAVGMAASVSPDSTSSQQFVERATLATMNKFVGIVTTKNANSVTITDTNATVYVAISGQTNVFASDLNGNIKRGDLITISPLKGIVMRTDDANTSILGTALEDFSSSNAQTVQVNTTGGGQKTAHINFLSINLNPRNLGTTTNAKQSFLTLLGQSITGKQVNNWQVATAIVIFFILIIVEGSILYGAVHSSIIAIGRNPLARSAVYKQLVQVMLIAVVVLGFGGSIIYAILSI